MKRMDENCFLKDSFYNQLPSHPALPPPTWGLLPPKDAGTSVDAGGASGPFPPNRPVRATPSPKRMLRAHAQLEWTLGAHQPPPPRDRYEHPLPQQTGTSNPFPQKDAGGACATSVDAGGASDPLPQETGTSTTPFPNRPVRATPSPKRMLRAHAQHQWTLGAHQTPLPQETGTSNPFPLTPTSLYKGITDRAHS